MDIDDDMRTHLDHVVNALVNETRGSVERPALQGIVEEAYAELAPNARIRTFLPVLTMRQARLILQAREYDTGKRPKDFTGVLLVCGTNAGRSQVGAALLRFYAAGRVDVVSAGQDPADEMHPEVQQYMRDHGVELTDYPKRLRPEFVRVADHIILVGSNVADIPEGKDVEHWAIPHLGGLPTEDMHVAVHAIDDRARAFLQRILPDVELPPSIFDVRP